MLGVAEGGGIMGQTKGRVGIGVMWVGVFSVLSFVGCSNSATEAPGSHPMASMNRIAPEAVGVSCPGPGDLDPQYLLYLLLDRSGSYFTDRETIMGMKEEASRYVREAPPGTAVYVAYISEASRRPKELVVRDAIPFEPAEVECTVANPFDRAQRRHCAKVKQQREARLVCVQEAYQRIEQQIDALVPTRARRTDVDGALMMAGEILNAFPEAEKAVVVLSDGEDTESKSVSTPLAGFAHARVVLRPPLGKGSVLQNGPISRYATKISEWGGRVSVSPMSLPMSPKLFQSYGSQTGLQDAASRMTVAKRYMDAPSPALDGR